MEDYTNKYKGEQIEVALFGGEYQEGVLTAYCSIEDVPHIELNGHILVPLQNVASLHCSSRCDAPEPDWPPRGLGDDDRDGLGDDDVAACGSQPLVNIAKRGCSLAILAALFGAVGWALGGYRAASVFVFCALLAALAVYAYADRALLGMLGAREYALAEDPLLRSTVDALAAKLGVVPPKLYLIPDGYPRALAAGRGPRGSALAVSTGLLGRCARPSSRP